MQEVLTNWWKDHAGNMLPKTLDDCKAHVLVAIAKVEHFKLTKVDGLLYVTYRKGATHLLENSVDLFSVLGEFYLIDWQEERPFTSRDMFFSSLKRSFPGSTSVPVVEKKPSILSRLMNKKTA